MKGGLLNDPRVKTILADEYGLRVEGIEAASIDMVCDKSLEGIDFLWPGDQLALAMYRERGGTVVRSDNIFNSPVVLYSWTPIVDKLAAAGVAQPEQGGSYYSIDLLRFVDLAKQGKTWTDLGLPGLHGKLRIRTSDPTKSNSGLLFAGLLANALNGGEVVDATTVEPLLPLIPPYFIGLLPTASKDLFEQFLSLGEGANPIIAAYESQLVEFILLNPAERERINQKVRILYPRPTVWATHPLIARTEKGALLLQALQDDEIQDLAWKENGFRRGNGAVVDPNVFQIAGIAPEITSVIDLPPLHVMDRVLAAIAAAIGSKTVPCSPATPTR